MTNTLTATLNTNRGAIKVRLFPDQGATDRPQLRRTAEGARKWADPRTGAQTSDKLYDGTVFTASSGLHDPGRRPARHRDRWAGLQVR